MPPRATATLLTLAALSGCGPSAKRPTDADIAAYVAQSEPSYLQVSGVKASFEAMRTLGSRDLPAGSWRMHVDFTLRAGQDLYAPPADTRQRRADFDRALAAFEMYRVPRIEAANQLAVQVGLMKQGEAAPEPAVPLAIVTHARQERSDNVILLAQPDGSGWKFAQLGAQALSDDAIGAPVTDLRATSPHTVFVMAGSEEARTAALREQRYLGALSKALTNGPK